MTTDDKSPWATIVGPCYTVSSMARALGWTEDAVCEAARDLRLLDLETSDGIIVYPAFQFHEGRVVDGLTEVLRVLKTGTTGRWTWAQFLNTALDGEDPPRVVDLLRVGRLDEALQRAENEAGAWNS